MPEKNEFVFTDENDRPLAGAELLVYRAEGNGKDWYGKEFDDVPDLEVTLDAEGRVVFGRELFGGPIVHTYGHSNGVVILCVRHEGRSAYLFQEVTDLNLRYMQGERKWSVYRRVVKFAE